MEDKTNNPKKPLRAASNYAKELKDTYLKNFGNRQPRPNKPESEDEIEQVFDDEPIGDVQKPPVLEEISEISDSEAIELLNDEINILQEKLTASDKERNELKEQAIRLAAELENLRRRSLKEKQEMLDYANERLLFNLLPIIDDIGAAVEAGKQSSDYTALITGIEMIQQKAKKLFEDAGVKKMEDTIGKPFDVNFHEALMVMPSELPEEHIVQVVQEGFMIHEKVLRHAKVITSSGQPEGCEK